MHVVSVFVTVRNIRCISNQSNKIQSMINSMIVHSFEDNTGICHLATVLKIC